LLKECSLVHIPKASPVLLARTALAVLTALALLAGVLVPGAAQAADDAGGFAAELDARMAGWLEQYGVPGAIVAYIEDGAVQWVNAYGVADRRSGAPMQPDMAMEFGSAGKAVAAWGVMRLVEQGKVALDEPANRYLARWQIPAASDGGAVTVRQLLTHTSGLQPKGYAGYKLNRPLPTLVEVLEGRNQGDGPVRFAGEPGAAADTGADFAVLQLLIEDVSGLPFADFMAQEITGPLGLESFAWAWSPGQQADAATPHGMYGERVPYQNLAAPAVGGEIASVGDFAAWLAAAVDAPDGEPPGRGVLQPATVAQMIALQAPENSMGLGYGVAMLDGDVWLNHAGSNQGWSALFGLALGARSGFVVATNSDYGGPLTWSVANLWANTTLGTNLSLDLEPTSFAWSLIDRIVQFLTVVLAVVLVVLAMHLAWKLSKERRWTASPSAVRVAGALTWLGVGVVLWWMAYSTLPLPVPAMWPDLTPSPPLDRLLAVLGLLALVSAAGAFTAARRAAQPASVTSQLAAPTRATLP
jgi:CubicO group peptidase (beta-lactamase class C family)